MENRREEIVKILRRYHLGAVILWHPDELVMALGYLPYLGLSFGMFTEQGTWLYLPENEPEPFLREPAHLVRFPMGMGEENPWDFLFGEMRKQLESLGLEHQKVGCMDVAGGASLTSQAAEEPALPEDLHARLDTLGAGVSFRCREALKGLYEKKLEPDVEALYLVHQTAEKGVDVFFQSLQEGKTEAQVQCAVEAAIACQTGKNGVFYARAWAQIQSGERSAQGGKYNTTTGKALAEGELVLMELGVCVNGYWGDLTRTGFVGKPSSQVQNRYALVLQAHQAAVSRIRPGILAREVYQAAAEVFQRQGCLHLFPHALGHGGGFRYHEFAPGLTPSNEMPLKAGMVLTVEPGLYEEGMGGIRVEDNYLVTEEGCKRLSLGSWELTRK